MLLVLFLVVIVGFLLAMFLCNHEWETRIYRAMGSPLPITMFFHDDGAILFKVVMVPLTCILMFVFFTIILKFELERKEYIQLELPF